EVDPADGLDLVERLGQAFDGNRRRVDFGRRDPAVRLGSAFRRWLHEALDYGTTRLYQRRSSRPQGLALPPELERFSSRGSPRLTTTAGLHGARQRPAPASTLPRMAIREATESDLPTLMPLLR